MSGAAVLGLIISTLSVVGVTYAGSKRLFSDIFRLIELNVQIREQLKLNNVAVESLRIYDSMIDSRLRDVENYLEKTTDFKIKK